LRQAYREGRVLFTEDKDFGELVYHFMKPAVGIVLIRIPVARRRIKWPRVRRLIESYGDRLDEEAAGTNTDLSEKSRNS
jgi:predicted nuclease of predicted toxin-antitoxin system